VGTKEPACGAAEAPSGGVVAGRDAEKKTKTPENELKELAADMVPKRAGAAR